MTDRLYIDLMAHEAPRPSRRKTRWPINTRPPKCDICGKQLAPGIDHQPCKESKP